MTSQFLSLRPNPSLNLRQKSKASTLRTTKVLEERPLLLRINGVHEQTGTKTRQRQRNSERNYTKRRQQYSPEYRKRAG